jgi:hypothetical protein
MHERRTISVDLKRDELMLLLAALTKYVEWFEEHSREDDRRSHPQAEVDELSRRAGRLADTLRSAWGPV